MANIHFFEKLLYKSLVYFFAFSYIFHTCKDFWVIYERMFIFSALFNGHSSRRTETIEFGLKTDFSPDLWGRSTPFFDSKKHNF